MPEVTVRTQFSVVLGDWLGCRSGFPPPPSRSISHGSAAKVLLTSIAALYSRPFADTTQTENSC